MLKHTCYLVFGFILLVAAGCQRSGDYRQVKQYTIEQFMNTEAIGGSSFSHDDKLILFSSKKTGIYNAYTVPAEGGTGRRVRVEDRERVQVVDQDRARIALEHLPQAQF